LADWLYDYGGGLRVSGIWPVATQNRNQCENESLQPTIGHKNTLLFRNTVISPEVFMATNLRLARLAVQKIQVCKKAASVSRGRFAFG
jgi:hypothetical protein